MAKQPSLDLFAYCAWILFAAKQLLSKAQRQHHELHGGLVAKL